MCFACDEVGVSNPDPFAAGLRSSDDLDGGDGNFESVSQKAAKRGVRLAIDGWGGDGYFQDPFSDSDNLIPPGPRLDENREHKVRPPRLKVQA